MFDLAVRNPMSSWNNSFGDLWNFGYPGHDYHSGWVTTTEKNEYPKIDVYDGEQELTIEAAIPGVNRDDVKITWKDDRLTIQASSQNEKSRKTKRYSIKELHRSSFSRSISLPSSGYDTDNIEAHIEDGMLTVKAKKLEHPKDVNKFL